MKGFPLFSLSLSLIALVTKLRASAGDEESRKYEYLPQGYTPKNKKLNLPTTNKKHSRELNPYMIFD